MGVGLLSPASSGLLGENGSNKLCGPFKAAASADRPLYGLFNYRIFSSLLAFQLTPGSQLRYANKLLKHLQFSAQVIF